jgi:hypothetical protein
LRILRSQLERYIAEKLGSSHLASTKTQTELRKVKKEIAELKKKLRCSAKAFNLRGLLIEPDH